ncbi:helix-turn-helix domain-containing protein [Mycobacterium adipatum]
MGPRRRKSQRDGAMPEIARIGVAFAERRIALRLTQQTLADLAGVSRSSVQSLERGSGSISFGSVIEIADALGLHVDVSAMAE